MPGHDDVRGESLHAPNDLRVAEHDREGKPVPGLTADDFQNKLNGKQQPVRALSYVQVAQQAATGDPELRIRLHAHREALRQKVLEKAAAVSRTG